MINRKLMLLGEMGVGKTSIVNRLVFNTFSADYIASIGTDVYQYECRPEPGGDPILLNVWDTDGSHGEAMFKSVYIRGSHGALIIGDAKRRRSLETMANLAERFEAELPGRFFRCVINKVDLLDEGETVALPEKMVAKEFPKAMTSASTGENIKDVFFTAATTMARRRY